MTSKNNLTVCLSVTSQNNVMLAIGETEASSLGSQFCYVHITYQSDSIRKKDKKGLVTKESPWTRNQNQKNDLFHLWLCPTIKASLILSLPYSWKNRASTALPKSTPQKWILRHATEPPSGGSSSSGNIVSYPYLLEFECWWNTDENKAYRLCVPKQTQYNYKKKNERKGSETMTNYDGPPPRVWLQYCIIMSFQSLFEINQSFALIVIIISFALCSKVLLFLLIG